LQFVRYGVVGASNTLLTLFVYTRLLGMGLHYLEAFAPAFAAGALNGYTLNRIWTFDGACARRADVARYVSVQLAGLGMNAVALIVLIEVVGFDRVAGQVIGGGGVSVLTFVLNRQWVFRAGAAGPERPRRSVRA
jgi:putative flippase GtrA